MEKKDIKVFTARIPKELYDRINESKSNRSFIAQVIEILERSFDPK